MLVKAGEAVPGDHIQAGTYVARGLGGSGRPSSVEHIAVVDHRYGHSGHLMWIKPICGVSAGRADTSMTGRLCKKCATKAEKEGIQT